MYIFTKVRKYEMTLRNYYSRDKHKRIGLNYKASGEMGIWDRFLSTGEGGGEGEGKS